MLRKMTLLSAIKKHRFLALGVALFTVLEALFAVIPAQVIGFAIDYLASALGHSQGAAQNTAAAVIFSRLPAGASPAKAVLALGLAYFLFSLASLLLGNFRGFLTTLLGEKCITHLRSVFFSRIMRSELAFFNANKTGDLVSRLINDTNEIRQIVISPVNGLVTGIFAMLWAVYFSFLISPQLTLFMVLPAPLMVWLGFYFGGKQKRVAKLSREALGALTSAGANRFKGLLTIKAFARERAEAERFDVLLGDLFALNIRGFRLTFWLWPAIGLVQAAVVAAILIRGGSLVLASVLTVGQLSILIQYLFRMYDPLISIARFYNSIAAALASLKRVEEITSDDAVLERDLPPVSPLGRLAGRIDVERLDFSYDHGAPCLNDISFSVEPGEKVALMGPSGGGKSTLLALLTRFYHPSAGRILLDRRPLSDYPLKELRSSVCLVPQEPVVFETSLAENLRFAKPEAGDHELEDALRKVKLGHLLERGGLNVNLGDMGSGLSLGEKQRIALARAFLLDPAVILLDEPVAHLDAENEKNVLGLITELFAGKTVIITSHKPAVLDMADRSYSLPGAGRR